MAKKVTYEELRREFKELENEVTECKRSEQALRESTKQLRTEQDLFKEAILAISHPFYAIDVQSYKIIMANPAAVALYGDCSDHPFCYSWTHSRTTPCSSREHPCPLEIIKERKQPVTVEHTHYDNQGKPLFFEIHAYPLFDAEGKVSKIIEHSLEITPIKRMQEAHVESEQRYHRLIESAHDIIQSIRPDGSLAFVNRAWHKILGYTETDLASMNLFDIIAPDSLQHCQELFSKVLTGQSLTNLPITFVAKDGTRISVEGNVNPRMLDGKIVSTHGIFRDVTERKLAEEKLAKYSRHLEEIIATLNVAQEVQQSLLPQHPPNEKRFDLAGSSIYCDETGGDYYDYIELPQVGPNVYGIVVGDVSGHGISSAIDMASIRAYLRGRATQGGSVAEIITDTNHLVSTDTTETGQFMTLFFLKIEAQTGRLTWVRAGHDPVLLYSPDSDHFEKLEGEGLPLGVDENWQFKEYTATAEPGQTLLLFTDGLLETRNIKDEMFGRNRFKEIIRRNADLGAEGIHLAIIDAVTTFQGKAQQEDDITLVVLKFL